MATKLSELFGKLVVSLAAAEKEGQQFEKGKKAAAGRLRKEAQVSKKIWQEIRVEVMGQLKAMPTKTRVKK
jgi:hypothetical protein